MALRLKNKWQNEDGSYVAKLYRCNEWEEWVVKFYREGVYQTMADYHTDDKEDATDTALFVLKGY
jgi:hypothetical protein